MFTVTYIITCYEDESIDQKIKWICLEQSVELPEEVVPESILQVMVGKVQEVESLSENQYRVDISWPLEIVGKSLTQFLNVLYGNISLGKGIKIVHVKWKDLAELFNGPKFGIGGIREMLGCEDRAMSCAVLKPMGLSPKELAEQAFELALGGIDIIKDDHGLADQDFSPFKERVAAVTDALQRAESKYGMTAAYFPNITASGIRIIEFFETAYDYETEGVMILPHLCGYEVMHELAQSDLNIPIIAHPAFSGALVSTPDHGFSPSFLYGELFRAFGADLTIYPNTGGRFSFTLDECHDINAAARTLDSPFNPILPMPGGGVKWQNLPKWIKEYGVDTVFVMGASLLKHPDGIRKAAAEVRSIL